MRYEFLEYARGEIAKCTKCASCQAGCPTYEETESETLVARGKIRLAGGVLNGEIGITDRVANDFFQCLSCMNCKTACPSGVDTMRIFSAMRSQIHEQRGAGAIAEFIFKWLLPYPRRLNVLAKLVGLSSIFYRLAPSWLAGLLPYSQGGIKRVTPDFLQRNLRSRVGEINAPMAGARAGGAVRRVVFYSGCMTDMAFPKTGVTVINKLREAGIEVIFPKEQVCCGAPSHYNGDEETTKRLARKNVEVLNSYGADAIVYSCATCGSVLGDVYPELFPDDPEVGKMAEKVVDFQKLLVELSVEAIMLSKNGSGKSCASRITTHAT